MTATARKPRTRGGPLVIRRGHRRPASPRNRRSATLTALTAIMLVYTLLPLAWLVINASKTQEGLFSSFGLWFDSDFALFRNIAATFTYDGGIFTRWLLNTLLYVLAGAGGATLLATVAGYGLAKFDFPGKKAVFAIVIGAVAVPGTALAVPTFLMFSSVGLTDTPWAIIIPSLVTPFGLYLMWTYAADAVPDEILESARVDGAREFQTFFRISLPLLAPGIVTVLLFAVVATWNNYFLPLIMLKDPAWYPLTLGLNRWNAQASTAGSEAIFNLVITGSLLTIVPLVAAFLLLQRYWQSGLAAGSVKE
ncbi:carbohydrate ABC transporter permease [Nonomuraea rosea]|uniref:Carbohydrate ABC transporter permease n=1 Tax=Nonomuraea rosea TaxID=638574 RepID=A0ABP6Y7P9_9ACTN